MAEGSLASTIPACAGFDFTPTLHQKAAGPTDPSNNPVKTPFVVCVTGAGKGLGYQISLAYARAGATGIVISSRTQKDLDALSSELQEINPKLEILAQVTDTTQEESVANLAAATKEKFRGRLDVCIANAGIISKYLDDGKLPRGILTDTDFERVINVNLVGTARTARHFAPLLISSGGANTFIVITSLAAHVVDSLLTPIAYNTSKVAVCRMIENMDNDHRKQDGLLSYAVHPGAVLTPQTEGHNKTNAEWDQVLSDDPGLCGGWLTWLTRERREWLSGRYMSCNWDVKELERMREHIVKTDMLKLRMSVKVEMTLEDLKNR